MPQAPDATSWRLDQLTDRLASLISQEPNPQAAMQAIARRLSDEDLSEYSPRAKESPQQFAQNVLRENPQMWDLVAEMTLPNLQAIETADDLISRLLPSRYDHG